MTSMIPPNGLARQRLYEVPTSLVVLGVDYFIHTMPATHGFEVCEWCQNAPARVTVWFYDVEARRDGCVDACVSCTPERVQAAREVSGRYVDQISIDVALDELLQPREVTCQACGSAFTVWSDDHNGLCPLLACSRAAQTDDRSAA